MRSVLSPVPNRDDQNPCLVQLLRPHSTGRDQGSTDLCEPQVQQAAASLVVFEFGLSLRLVVWPVGPGQGGLLLTLGLQVALFRRLLEFSANLDR